MAHSIMCAPDNSPRNAGQKSNPKTVQDAASEGAQSIIGQVEGLQSTAEGLRSAGENILAQMHGFGGTNIPPINFDADLGGGYGLNHSQSPGIPSLYEPDIDRSELDDPPDVEFEDFEESGIQDPPEMHELEWPEEPDLELEASFPEDLSIDEIDGIDDPPDVSIDLDSLPELPELNKSELDDEFPEIDYIEIEPPDWADIPEVDESQLDRVDKLQAFEEPEEYDFLIAERALATAERMVHGDFILNVDLLAEGTRSIIERAADNYASQFTSLWRRRGLESFRQGASGYTERVKRRILDDTRAHLAAQQQRWVMKLVPTAIQLSVDAHSFFVEQLGEALDAKFEMLVEQQQALISTYDRATVEYKKLVDKVLLDAAKYRQQIETKRVKAVEYSVFVEEQKNLARYNQAMQQAYSAEEQVKATELIEFEANIAQAKAEIRVYNAKMKGVSAKVQAIGAELARFEGASARWQAGFVRLRADYQARRAQNQSIIARNRAEAARVSAAGVDIETVLGESHKAVHEMIRWSTDLKAQIANLTNENLEVDRDNVREVSEYQIDVAEYQLSTAEYQADTIDSLARNNAISQKNSALGQMADAVNDSLGRAAELTHQYQVQLSQAATDYASQRAQGEAAKVSGAASSVRGTMGATARGDIRYRSNIAKDFTERNTMDTSQSNSCRTIIREAYY